MHLKKRKSFFSLITEKVKENEDITEQVINYNLMLIKSKKKDANYIFNV